VISKPPGIYHHTMKRVVSRFLKDHEFWYDDLDETSPYQPRADFEVRAHEFSLKKWGEIFDRQFHRGLIECLTEYQDKESLEDRVFRHLEQATSERVDFIAFVFPQSSYSRLRSLLESCVNRNEQMHEFKGRVMAWRISQDVLETSLYGNVIKKEDSGVFSKRARIYQSSLDGISRPNLPPRAAQQVTQAVIGLPTYGSSVSPGSCSLLYVKCSLTYYEQNLVSRGFRWNPELKQAEKTAGDPKQHSNDLVELKTLLRKRHLAGKSKKELQSHDREKLE